MNSYQEGFCRVDEVLGANVVNKLSCAINFKKDVDVDVLVKAVELTCLNDYLRTKIDQDGMFCTDHDHAGELCKVVRFAGREELNNYIDQRKGEPVFWRDSYCAGFEILICEKEVSLLCWFHHLMYDGLSAHKVLDHIIGNYSCQMERKEALTDFAQESLIDTAAYSTSDQYRVDRDFWAAKSERLRDIRTVFQTDILETGSGRIQERLGCFLTKKIEKYCQEHALSTPTFFLAITALLMRPYFVSEDMCVGVSLHNRKRHQIDRLGMVLNTLPLIVEATADEKFTEFCLRINSYMSEIYRYRAYPQKDIGYSPQVLFSYQINSFDSSTELFHCDWLFSNETTIPLAISINDIHRSGDHQVIMDYRISDISVNHAHFLMKKFAELCQLVTGEDCVVYPDVVLTPSEQSILNGLNPAKKVYPLDQTVAEIFAKTVQIHADKTAIQFKDHRMTYAELNDRADKISDCLSSRGIGAKDVVAVVFEKSVEMVCAIWGIIKAGAVYLPIDPQWPRSRAAVVYELAQAKGIITDSEIAAPDHIPVIVYSEIEREGGPAQEPVPTPPAPKRGRNTLKKSAVQDPLYVIFTSGTTGVPKGVCVSHKNIINLARNETFAIQNEDRFLQIINSSFDVSVMGYIVALMNGATLVIAEDRVVLDPSLTADLVKSEGITILNTTTALLNHWLPYLESFSGLRTMMTGGEKMTPYTANQAIAHLSGKLVNAYGPTETTVFSTVQVLDRAFETDVPIGRPIINTEVFVVTDRGSRAAVNQTGELWVGGEGVSMGYLNNREETKKSFVKNPFGEGLVYKTGDLCLINEQGVLEFKGRLDGQIKIRGYRIETSEIENALHSMSQISHAVVAVENNRLVAYVVPEEGGTVSHAVESLQNRLPAYMIPSLFKEVREIPLTLNGKIDHRAISQYVVRNIRMDSPEDALTDTEVALKAIFADTLGISELSLYDNFFFLGGTSLDAMRVVKEVNEKFNQTVKVSEFYKNSTVESLAGLISLTDPRPRRAFKTTRVAIGNPDAALGNLEVPVTPAQAMMFSLWNIDNEAITYNIPVLIKLRKNIRVRKLERGLTKLVERHEALRSRIVFNNHNEIVQQIDNPYEVRLSWKRGPINRERIGAEIEPFDLSQGYSFRASLFKSIRDRYILLDFHHCFIDGASVEFLLRDLEALYDDDGNLDGSLAEPYPFSAYAQRVSEQDTQDNARFWQTALEGTLPANIDIRVNRNRTGNSFADRSTDGSDDRSTDRSTDSQNTGVQEFTLNRAITGLLRDSAKERGVSLQNYLLACFTVLLAKYDNEGKSAIGTILSGRTDKRFDNAVGMYVNTIPVVFDADTTICVKEHIDRVIDYLAEAYDHQSFGFNNIVNVSGARREPSRNPVFDIMFMVQNVAPFTRLGHIEDIIQTQEKFDVTVEARICEETITIRTTYKDFLYDSLTIELLGARFQKLLYQIVNNDTVEIRDLSIVSDLDTQLLLQYNHKEPTPKRRGALFVAETVSQCMAMTARKYSHRKAVYKGDKFLTYKKLYTNATKIAAALQREGCGRNDIVGLYSVRSMEMIEAIWGIVLAGAAYMPLDTDMPKVRMKYMLRECKVKLVVTFGTDRDMVPDGYLVKDVPELKEEADGLAYCVPANSPRDLLYVMYTSGSTGNPKGVQISHQNVLEFVRGMGDIKVRKKFLAVCNYAFDASMYDQFIPLLEGGSVTVLDKEEAMDLSCISQTVLRKEINYLVMPAALFNLMSDTDLKKMTSIRRIITGGEKASSAHMRRAISYLPGKVYNAYGPTEATVCCAMHQVSLSDVEADIPIGHPYGSAKVHIIDDKNRDCPVGISGQIIVTGSGVSKGYVNSWVMNKSKFYINDKTGEMTYYSGDIGRWNVRGLLEYNGRDDDQVKIRGFRVELEEIRQKFLELDYVEDAAILALEKNQIKEIYAYYITSKNGPCSKEIDDYLKRSLPNYMLPRFYAEIEQIPLNQNSKVDTAKLSLIPTEVPLCKTFEEFQTLTEKAIADIWQVFFDTKVGRHDDFFELGGHSIQVIRFVSEMKKEGFDIDAMDIINNSSLASLARHIDRKQTNLLHFSQIDRSDFLIEPHASFRKMSHHNDSKAIFVLPGHMLNIVYGMTYSKLANAVRSHSLYLGTFTDNKDCVKEFAKDLIKIGRKYDEIWLLGYSFGGCLAYEVAKLAISPKIRIEGIIMFDSFFKTNPNTGVGSHIDKLTDPSKIRCTFEERFDFYKDLDTSIKESIEKCFLGFLGSTSGLINHKEKLDTSIFFLRAEEPYHDVEDTRHEWQQGCAENYREYQAYGKHMDMLNVVNMDRNIRIINDILSQPLENQKVQPYAEMTEYC